jgi:hypothetical protein
LWLLGLWGDNGRAILMKTPGIYISRFAVVTTFAGGCSDAPVDMGSSDDTTTGDETGTMMVARDRCAVQPALGRSDVLLGFRTTGRAP